MSSRTTFVSLAAAIVAGALAAGHAGTGCAQQPESRRAGSWTHLTQPEAAGGEQHLAMTRAEGARDVWLTVSCQNARVAVSLVSDTTFGIDEAAALAVRLSFDNARKRLVDARAWRPDVIVFDPKHVNALVLLILHSSAVSVEIDGAPEPDRHYSFDLQASAEALKTIIRCSASRSP